MSVPQSNSAYRMERPTPDVERTRVTPGIPLRAVSRGKVTSCSTASGAITPASVNTVTNALLRSGNTSTGVRHAVMAPPTPSSGATARANGGLCRLLRTLQLNLAWLRSADLCDKRCALHHPAVV